MTAFLKTPKVYLLFILLLMPLMAQNALASDEGTLKAIQSSARELHMQIIQKETPQAIHQALVILAEDYKLFRLRLGKKRTEKISGPRFTQYSTSLEKYESLKDVPSIDLFSRIELARDFLKDMLMVIQENPTNPAYDTLTSQIEEFLKTIDFIKI